MSLVGREVLVGFADERVDRRIVTQRCLTHFDGHRLRRHANFGKRRLLSREAIGIQSYPPRTLGEKIEQRVARSGRNLRGVDDRVVEIAIREREDVDRLANQRLEVRLRSRERTASAEGR